MNFHAPGDLDSPAFLPRDGSSGVDDGWTLFPGSMHPYNLASGGYVSSTAYEDLSHPRGIHQSLPVPTPALSPDTLHYPLTSPESVVSHSTSHVSPVTTTDAYAAQTLASLPDADFALSFAFAYVDDESTTVVNTTEGFHHEAGSPQSPGHIVSSRVEVSDVGERDQTSVITTGQPNHGIGQYAHQLVMPTLPIPPSLSRRPPPPEQIHLVSLPAQHEPIPPQQFPLLVGPLSQNPSDQVQHRLVAGGDPDAVNHVHHTLPFSLSQSENTLHTQKIYSQAPDGSQPRSHSASLPSSPHARINGEVAALSPSIDAVHSACHAHYDSFTRAMSQLFMVITGCPACREFTSRNNLLSMYKLVAELAVKHPDSAEFKVALDRIVECGALRDDISPQEAASCVPNDLVGDWRLAYLCGWGAAQKRATLRPAEVINTGLPVPSLPLDGVTQSQNAVPAYDLSPTTISPANHLAPAHAHNIISCQPSRDCGLSIRSSSRVSSPSAFAQLQDGQLMSEVSANDLHERSQRLDVNSEENRSDIRPTLRSTSILYSPAHRTLLERDVEFALAAQKLDVSLSSAEPKFSSHHSPMTNRPTFAPNRPDDTSRKRKRTIQRSLQKRLRVEKTADVLREEDNTRNLKHHAQSAATDATDHTSAVSNFGRPPSTGGPQWTGSQAPVRGGLRELTGMPPSARSDFISQQSVLSVHQPDDSVRCARSEDLIGPGTPGNPNPYRASRGGAERLTR